ncbi:hypothetical protein [Microbacterium sp.]|uniref:hypothetical protein n=1 Tax=Microbacterium sp. TaxID=51671 RepID=UPI00322165F7
MQILTPIVPGPGEPVVADWHPVALADLVERLRALTAGGDTVPLVAVDGRGGGGKSTLAARLAAATPGAAVIAIDDLVWNAPLFDWADLAREGILAPVAEGRAVRYRPPAWQTHGRDGVIEAPADASMIVLEGVGASCREIADGLAAAIWVQSDFAEAERRGLARDIASGVNGDAEESTRFWHEWMAAELAFLAADRPWQRADLVVAGTRPGAHPVADGPILISPGPLR